MRILIVDDDYVSGIKLKTILAPYGDCDIAPSGQIALELVESGANKAIYHDLIILDLNLPDMSGLDVLNQTRQLENRLLQSRKLKKKSKVLVVTGSTDESEMRRILAIGADAYLNKPFNAKSIQAKLESLNVKPGKGKEIVTGSRRILIVEDCYANSIMLRGALEPYGDCDMAPTGSIALALFTEARRQSVPYEFVALDLNLPDMNGNKILKLIRSVERLDKARGHDLTAYVVIISSSKDRNSIMEAAHNGVNGYVLKPFSYEQIYSELAKAGFKKTDQ